MDRRVKERLVGATILVVLIILIVPELLSGSKTPMPPAPTSAAGPAEAVRNVTVDLATSKATPAENGTAGNTSADNTAASAAASQAEQNVTAAGAVGSGDAGQGNAAPGAATGGEPTAAGGVPATESANGEGAAGAPAVPGRTNRIAGPPTIATLKAQQPARGAAPDIENEPSIPRSVSQASKPGGSSVGSPTGLPNHHWAVQLGSFASRANAEKLMRRARAHDAAVYMSPSGKGTSARYRVRIGPLADREAADRVVAKLKKEGQSASVVSP
jgi:DedD protein